MCACILCVTIGLFCCPKAFISLVQPQYIVHHCATITEESFRSLCKPNIWRMMFDFWHPVFCVFSVVRALRGRISQLHHYQTTHTQSHNNQTHRSVFKGILCIDSDYHRLKHTKTGFLWNKTHYSDLNDSGSYLVDHTSVLGKEIMQYKL